MPAPLTHIYLSQEFSTDYEFFLGSTLPDCRYVFEDVEREQTHFQLRGLKKFIKENDLDLNSNLVKGYLCHNFADLAWYEFFSKHGVINDYERNTALKLYLDQKLARNLNLADLINQGHAFKPNATPKPLTPSKVSAWNKVITKYFEIVSFEERVLDHLLKTRQEKENALKELNHFHETRFYEENLKDVNAFIEDAKLKTRAAFQELKIITKNQE